MLENGFVLLILYICLVIIFLHTKFSFQAGDFLKGLPSFNKENFTRFNADGVQAKSTVSVAARSSWSFDLLQFEKFVFAQDTATKVEQPLPCCVVIYLNGYPLFHLLLVKLV